MLKRLFLLVLLPYQLLSFSQNGNSLYQKWYLRNISSCNDSIIRTKEKWNIEFLSVNKAMISTNGGLKSDRNYALVNDTLKINDLNYFIEKSTKDSLILLNKLKNNCNKYYFISESKIHELQKQDYFINKGDTVYYANEYNAPKLKNETNFLNYFMKSTPFMISKDNCVFQISFIITKEGEVGDYNGNISCLKNPMKKIDKIIDVTRGKWEPMALSGVPVSSLIRVRFKQGETKIINGD